MYPNYTRNQTLPRLTTIDNKYEYLNFQHTTHIHVYPTLKDQNNKNIQNQMRIRKLVLLDLLNAHQSLMISTCYY